jgi:hypothetical protein
LSHESTGEYVVGPNRFQLGLGKVVAKEEHRAEWASMVASHEHVDIANMVREQDDCGRRRMRIKPFPELRLVLRWCQRVQDEPLTSGFDKS